MISVKIAENLKLNVNFSREELGLFFQYAQREVIEKNKFVTQANEDIAKLIHIESGCLMTFVADQADQKNVLQFGVEHWWTGDLESVLKNKKSNQSIKAVDRTIIYSLDLNAYNKLVDSSHNYERYFRILFQNSLISHQKRIIRNISYTAEQRYLAFVEQFPQLETTVSQKYIASYLGITPEFFSKLKKMMAERELR